MLKQDGDSTNTDYVLYIAFSVNPTSGWSCPIRIDKPLVRIGFSVQKRDLSVSMLSKNLITT